MKLGTISGLISFIVLCGCSPSSSTSGERDSDSLGTADTLRLISRQVSYSSGNSGITSYEYDEIGNLIGSVNGNMILTYNIDPNGRIINIEGSTDGIAIQASLIHFYDAIGGLRRIDNLGSIQGVGVIGVSGFDLYRFESNLATTLESRFLPFEEIVLNGQVDESAGTIYRSIEFEYDGERLIRELIDDDGNGVVDMQRDYTYNSDGTLSSALDTGMSANSYVYTYEQGACNRNWGNSTHRYFCVAGDGL